VRSIDVRGGCRPGQPKDVGYCCRRRRSRLTKGDPARPTVARCGLPFVPKVAVSGDCEQFQPAVAVAAEFRRGVGKSASGRALRNPCGPAVASLTSPIRPCIPLFSQLK
jgi:hypothetical protein